MNGAVWVVALYGIVSLVGGVIGYLKASSVASLVAGSLSGLILLACAYGMKSGHATAAVVSVLIALALGGRFLGTWRRTHRLMPDLLMVVLSLATLVTVGGGLLSR